MLEELVKVILTYYQPIITWQQDLLQIKMLFNNQQLKSQKNRFELETFLGVYCM